MGGLWGHFVGNHTSTMRTHRNYEDISRVPIIRALQQYSGGRQDTPPAFLENVLIIPVPDFLCMPICVFLCMFDWQVIHKSYTKWHDLIGWKVNVQLNQCGPHNQGFCHDCVRVCWFPKHRHNTHIHTQTHTQTLGYEDHTGLTGLYPKTDTTYTLT